MSLSGEKSFQFVKIVSPLFCIVVKFCSTKRLFAHISVPSIDSMHMEGNVGFLFSTLLISCSYHILCGWKALIFTKCSENFVHVTVKLVQKLYVLNQVVI